MAVNILDDDVIRRNQALVSSIQSVKEGAIEIPENQIDLTQQPKTNQERIEAERTQEAKTNQEEITTEPENYDYTFLRDQVVNPENTRFPEVKNSTDFKINTETESFNENEEFKYNVVYNNDFWEANNFFGEGRAKLHENALDQETVNINDLEVRNEDDSLLRELSIFLFMLFPYIGTSTVLNIRDAAVSPNVVGLATSASQNAYFLLQNLRYFTPFELGKYFLHNFYTLNFLKEMTIKYPPGRMPTGAPSAVNWDGKPDLFFGQGSSAVFYLKELHNLGSAFRETATNFNDGSQALTQFKDGGDQQETRPAWVNGSTMPMSPQIYLLGHSAYSFYKKNPTNMLGPTSKKEQENYPFVVSIPVYETRAGKWIVPFGDGKRENLEGAVEYYNIQERDADDLSNLIINRDVNKFRDNSFGIKEDTGSWLEIAENGKRNNEAGNNFYDEAIVSGRRNEDAENYILNDDVLFISFPENKLSGLTQEQKNNWIESGQDGDGKRLSLEDAIKQKNRNDKFQVGSILVTPIAAEADDLPRFWIPFEFNPDIQEGDLSANYEATSVLSRIGEMQSYSNTNALTVTINAKYIAVSQGDGESEMNGQSWMDDFTMSKVQAIEAAYRSLVLPHHPDETDEDQGYRYVKPPILRVVMGSANEEQGESPYSNLLTYQTNTVVEGKLGSTETLFGGNKRLRNFITTGISIKKSLEETPVRLDDSGRILDTFGFDVTLNLTEISPSYMDTMPDYKRFFEQYRNVINNEKYIIENGGV